MPRTRIEPIESREAWRAAVPVVRQLWSHVDREFVEEWFDEDDYRPFGLYRIDAAGADDGSSAEGVPRRDGAPAAPIGVVGVSVQRVLHHARHAWIHDLVVDEAHRGDGHGTDLLAFVESWARDRDCEYVALALREGNDAAAEFYDENGLERWGHVVETEL